VKTEQAQPTMLTLRGVMDWFKTQLEVNGYRALPCRQCDRTGSLGVHDLHAGLEYLLASQEALSQRAEKAEAEVSALRDQLETERLKLAACTTAALGNTPETVAQRLDREHPYWSASYGDVCAAVDREMALRDQLVQAQGAEKLFYERRCALMGYMQQAFGFDRVGDDADDATLIAQEFLKQGEAERAALGPYLVHRLDCEKAHMHYSPDGQTITAWIGEKPCTCGLDTILRSRVPPTRGSDVG
jgi:hypothetical protein